MAAAAAAHPELEFHALCVLRAGKRVFEQYWEPYRAGDRALGYSVSKTFTATAIGLAVGEGLLRLDDRVADLLAEPLPAETGPGRAEHLPSPASIDHRVAELTVHHLLSMSTGHTEDTLAALETLPPQQWAARFLTLRPQAPVGSRHVYNNGASFMLGELIRRRTGEDLLDYLRPRVLEPLGIDATWDTDPLGRCLGWTGLHLDVRGLAAMGELLRCDGVWQGRRLLPEGWVTAATSAQIPTQPDESSGREWTLGYGYQVWMGREGYRLDGAYGQFAFVLPERGLVIAVQSAQSCTQVLVDLVWEHLDDFGTSLAGPAETTAVPLPSDSGQGTGWSAPGAVPLDASLMTPGEELSPAPDIADVLAQREGAELRLSMVAEGHRVELVTAPGSWRRGSLALGDVAVPVALAGGADDAGDLVLRLVFTDTPHTLRLRLGSDGSAGAAWKVAPLQGPGLAAMRAH